MSRIGELGTWEHPLVFKGNLVGFPDGSWGDTWAQQVKVLLARVFWGHSSAGSTDPFPALIQGLFRAARPTFHRRHSHQRLWATRQLQH